MKYLFITIGLLLSFNLLNAQNYTPEMILVEGGTFQMGREGSAFLDETQVHSVTLSGFYLSKFEVTIEQFTNFCIQIGMNSPIGNGNNAAYNISWQEAVMYANWLSKLNDLDPCYTIKRDKKTFSVVLNNTANGYRLPTEAEWEFAARGGSSSKGYAYSGADDPNDVSWNLASGNTLHQVGQKLPNELGFYDMSGNVMEWCWDYYDPKYYFSSPKTNPLGPPNGSTRVCRGGNFKSNQETVRVTRRIYYDEDYRDEGQGLRLARNK